ncbi:MAG: hypothetical protein K2K34_06045 [Oscillospiraceae bacterium]|nr:hypothetical protein [Oscillospiraceae bacterium]
MKKKISLILAFLMAATMLAGCKKTNEDSAGLPDVGGDSSSMPLTQMTTEPEPETTTTETTTVPEDTTTEDTTSESETETSETETTTAASSETTAASASTAAAKAWNETEISETLYIKTSCYSRTQAIVGSESVKKYDVGQKINIVAATDTGYYKLADGTFIHSDYVTDQKPTEATQATTTAPKKPDPIEETTKKPSNPAVVNASYTKSYKDRYPYQQLNKSEQQLYADIVEAAESFETQVDVPSSLSSDDIVKVYALVYNQEPQLFWMSNIVPVALGGMLNLQYDLTPSQAASAQKEIDATVSDIMSKVNGYSSTVSRLKVIYDWVITHNTFSLQGNYRTCGIYNGLTDGGELQCQGYAKTVLYLCDIAGIECMVVTGNNTEGSTHAWNVVYCDNGYYILDTTWGDPMNNYGRRSYVRYLFFLANDDMIRNSHLNVSTVSRGNGNRIKLYNPPACTKTACYYFKAYNKEYSDLESATQAMYAEIDAAVAAGKNVAHIRVTDHKTWETLRDKKYWKAFQNYAKEKDSSVKNLVQQTYLTEDILVVEYDIAYND